MRPSRSQPLRSIRALIHRVRRTSPLADRWHSVSSTREYERCPRRYRFAYLERRPEDRPVPPSWRFGSVVHAGLEAAYQMAMADPSRPRTDLLQAATVAVHAHWDRYGMGDDGAYRDRAIWLTTRALVRDVIDVRGVHILGVEMRFRDTSDERTRIAGIADLVLERPDGTLEIIDHKVTSYWARPEDLRDDLQLNLYGDLARRQWPAQRRIVATHHYPHRTGDGQCRTRTEPHGRRSPTRARDRGADPFRPGVRADPERCLRPLPMAAVVSSGHALPRSSNRRPRSRRWNRRAHVSHQPTRAPSASGQGQATNPSCRAQLVGYPWGYN